MNKRIRIEMTGPGRGEVIIDGEKLKGVTKVVFTSEVGCVNKVELHVLAAQVAITGDAEVDTTSIDSTSREYERGAG